MSTITKDLLKALRIDADAALAAVGAKHGVSLRLGNGTFTALNATFKLEVATLGEGGEVIDKSVAYLRQNLTLLGLKEEHLNQVFTLGKQSFTLRGYKNTATLKPFVIRDLDTGKDYVATVGQITRALGLPDGSVR